MSLASIILCYSQAAKPAKSGYKLKPNKAMIEEVDITRRRVLSWKKDHWKVCRAGPKPQIRRRFSQIDIEFSYNS